MCFVHADGLLSRRAFIQQAPVSAATAAVLMSASSELVSGSEGLTVAGMGDPDIVVAAPELQAAQTIDGFSKTLHNRWNRDLPAVATVRQGDAVQFLCRDALDIGEAARTLTPEGVLMLDLGKIHPLTGPVAVEGAEPGDILEVEIVDVAPLVDFGYVVISGALGLFGSLRPDILASLNQFTEASQISDPNAGPVPSAIPSDQPFSSGAPFVQLFSFNKGQNKGFATFVGKDSGKHALIPLAPFMGTSGVAPLRRGMYRTIPPNVSGGMGGNTDIKQFVKGSKIQYPVYVEGAKFSAGDGHMAQGDGEVCVTAVETLMAVTCTFRVIKNVVIESPRAMIPAADPTQLT